MKNHYKFLTHKRVADFCSMLMHELMNYNESTSPVDKQILTRMCYEFMERVLIEKEELEKGADTSAPFYRGRWG